MNRVLFVAFVALAVFEILTLGVLLVNLATVHDPVVARIIGPVHGAIYLTVVLIALLTPGLRWSARLLGLIPVVGGVLTAWRSRMRRTPAE